MSLQSPLLSAQTNLNVRPSRSGLTVIHEAPSGHLSGSSLEAETDDEASVQRTPSSISLVSKRSTAARKRKKHRTQAPRPRQSVRPPNSHTPSIWSIYEPKYEEEPEPELPEEPPEPPTPRERFLAFSDPVKQAVSPISGRKWDELNQEEKKSALSGIFVRFQQAVYPNRIDYDPLTVSTEKRTRALEYYQSKFFLEFCKEVFEKEVGGLPVPANYPAIDTVEFESFAYHILVAFPTIMDNIRRYKGVLPNEILARVLGLDPKEEEKASKSQKTRGLQALKDHVDVHPGPNSTSTADLPRRGTVDFRLFSEQIKHNVEHRRRQSMQIQQQQAYEMDMTHEPYNPTQEIDRLLEVETGGISTVTRRSLPAVFGDNDPWYTKARKLVFYVFGGLTSIFAGEMSEAVSIPVSFAKRLMRKKDQIPEEDLIFSSRKEVAVKRVLQRKEAAEREEAVERESMETYAFVWIVISSFATNFKSWWYRTMSSRIFVDDALQEPHLPIPWNIHIIENEMDHLGHQQLRRARKEPYHSLEDCLYYIRINCRTPETTLEYPRWRTDFGDLFWIMHEYGKIDYETTNLIQHKIVDYEDNLHYYRILYEFSTQPEKNKSWTFLDWKTSLFVMADPIDDFGKMNMLPLQHLLFFGRYYPAYMNQVIQHSLDPALGYPFGLAVAHITSTLKSMLDNGCLKIHFYNLKPNRHFVAHYFVIWCLLVWEFDKAWRLYHGGAEESDPTIKHRYSPLFAPKPDQIIPPSWKPTDKTGRDEMHFKYIDQPLPEQLMEKWKRSWVLRKFLHISGFNLKYAKRSAILTKFRKSIVKYVHPEENLDFWLSFMEQLRPVLDQTNPEMKFFPWLQHPEEAFNAFHDRVLTETFNEIRAYRKLEAAVDQSLRNIQDGVAEHGRYLGKTTAHQFMRKAVSNLVFRDAIPGPADCNAHFAKLIRWMKVQKTGISLPTRKTTVTRPSSVASPDNEKRLTFPQKIDVISDDDEADYTSPLHKQIQESQSRLEDVLKNRADLKDYYDHSGYLFVGLKYDNAMDFEDYISLNKHQGLTMDQSALPESLRWLEHSDWKALYSGKHKWMLTRKKVRRNLDVQRQDAKNIELMHERTSVVDHFVQTVAYQHQPKELPARLKLGNPIVHHPVSKWFKVKFVPFESILTRAVQTFLDHPFSISRLHYGPFHHFFTTDDEFYPWLYVEEQEKRKKSKANVERERQRQEACVAHKNTQAATNTAIQKAREAALQEAAGKLVAVDDFAIRWQVKFGADFTQFGYQRKDIR